MRNRYRRLGIEHLESRQLLTVFTLESQVDSGSDDVEEQPSGSVKLTSGDLELVDTKRNQTVGVRFNALDIPTGAAIVNAYIQFQADEVDGGATSLTIQADDTDHATTFTTSNGNVTLRPRTAAAVSWSAAPWTNIGDVGPAQQTPNLAPVIQEVIDRPGWSSGNSLAFIITGNGTRTAESYEGTQVGAPRLHVEFTDGTGPVVATTVDDLFHTTTVDDGESTDSDDVVIQVQNGGSLTVLDKQIDASTDDAEEQPSGSVKLTSGDLELVDTKRNQTVGMRFNALDIPIGAVVVDAYIQFQVEEVDSGATSLTVQAEDTDHAATFRTSNEDVSSRPRTQAAISWSPDAWTTVGEAGADQQTPNLAPLIQEVISRPDWSSGNSIAFIITGNGTRAAESYDGSQSGAPRLHVEFMKLNSPDNEQISIYQNPDFSPQIPVSLSLQGKYSSPERVHDLTLFNVANDAVTISSWALGAPSGHSLESIFAKTAAEVRELLSAYSTTNGIDPLTNDLVILDIESGLHPTLIGEYEGDPALQRDIIEANTMRIGVAREFFPNARLSLYGVVNLSASYNIEPYNRQMRGLERAKSLGMFAELDAITPNLYHKVGPNDGARYSVEHLKWRIGLTIDGANKLTEGTDLEVVVITSFQIFNGSSANYRDPVDPVRARLLMDIVQQYAIGVDRIVFWAGYDTGQNSWDPGFFAALGETVVSHDFESVTDLAEFDGRYGFWSTGNLYEDWGGWNEKWILADNEDSYFVTPNGNLYEWAGGRDLSASEAIAFVGPEVWDNISLLVRGAVYSKAHRELAHEQAIHLDSQHGFRADNNKDYRNWGGEDEKWVEGADKQWYFIIPAGELFRWNKAAGKDLFQSEKIANLSKSYWLDLGKLVNASEAAS